jgi:hypothetical protein
MSRSGGVGFGLEVAMLANLLPTDDAFRTLGTRSVSGIQDEIVQTMAARRAGELAPERLRVLRRHQTRHENDGGTPGRCLPPAAGSPGEHGGDEIGREWPRQEPSLSRPEIPQPFEVLLQIGSLLSRWLPGAILEEAQDKGHDVPADFDRPNLAIPPEIESEQLRRYWSMTRARSSSVGETIGRIEPSGRRSRNTRVGSFAR